MSKRTKLMRVDPSLIDVFDQFKKNGRVETFPEFSRLLADEVKIKKKDLRFFK